MQEVRIGAIHTDEIHTDEIAMNPMAINIAVPKNGPFPLRCRASRSVPTPPDSR